jgi:membrane fusion protein (multidrug efflux system)
MKRVTYWLGSLAILLMVGCNDATSSPSRVVPEVEVVEVVQQDVPVYGEWVGTTEGLVTAQIRAQVTGYLLRRTYLEGGFVKQGDLLFEIDRRRFQAAVDQAKADLARAKAQRVKAELDVKRDIPLAKTGGVSRKELDDSVQAYEAAQAQVLSAKAALESAEINLGFTKITASIDGIVGIARAQIGDLVGPDDELTSISTVDPIRVYFPISEQEYLGVASWIENAYQTKFQDQEPRLELILADGSQYPHKGKYFLVDRQVDVTTGTIRVAGLFPNPGNVLRPGQYAKVRTATRTIQGALLIPQRAVMELQGAYQVAVVNPDNTVELRPVKVRDRVGPLWIIEQGLAKGDHVVTAGLQKVNSGMTVKPKLTQPESGEKKPELLSAASPSSM